MANHDDLPEVPKLAPVLPPHPGKAAERGQGPGSNQKAAIATTAASAFVTPVLVLSVGGYFLDKKIHDAVPWFAMLGVVVGMIVGITALLRIIKKLEE